MADELGAELSLDLDNARREIESFRRDLEDELEGAVSSFGDAYERVVGNLPTIEPEINSDAITDEINGAVRSADTELGVTADVDALQSEVSEALGAVHPEVTVDTDPMVDQIEGLFDSFHPELTPEIDTSAIESSLDELSAAGSGLGDSLSGGLSDAALQGQELTDTLSDLGQETEQASDGLGNVSNVSTTLATAFSAARGEGRQVIKDLTGLAPAFGPAVAGALGLTAGFVALFEAGERSLASVERAQVVLGDAAQRLEHINVGGLSGSLGDLAIQAGVSGGALRQAATNAAQLGLQSGHSTSEVTDFAEKVNALALRAVALNPALGEAGSVAERLNLVLGRGGRFLNRYQLDLTSAEITTRALADTGKTAVRDLTSFERSVAGADIAVEKLGTTLGDDFRRGAETTTVQLKSIRAELNAAFARAGAPLVEPTIEGLHALADAGAGVSTALGAIGKGALPVFATGLETVGESAGVVAEALGAIPGPVLAIAAAALVMDRAFGGVERDIRSFQDLKTVAGFALDNMAGRAVVAVGALAALDAGLGAVGTSTKELGVAATATGAAIGFTFGGPQGAAIGATVGAFVDMIKAETSLEKATKEVDAEFTKAESSAGNLRQALFANADTAVTLGAAIANIRINLAEFVQTASAFKTLGVADDLHRIGLSAAEVGDLSQQGEAGLVRFFDRLQKAGEVTIEFKRALVGDEQVRVLGKQLEQMGIGASVTGQEFAALSKDQQRLVLDALKLDGANTKLIVAFEQLQKQARAAGREEFAVFAATNKLSPAIVRAARESSRAADGTIDWAKALTTLGNAAIGILPEFGRLTAQSALLRRELSGIIAATDAAAQSIPTLGSGFSQALEGAFFDASANITGKPLLDPEKLIGNTVTATFDFGVFFGNIQKIADQGAGNVATALLQLGPSNLGARVAAELAANEPLFREGLEKALEGMSKAQLVSDSILSSLKARAAFIANIQGSEMEKLLQQEFGTLDISTITTPQIIAFIQKYGDGGNAAAKELVDKFNVEMASRKIAGLDTQPIFDSINAAKEKIPAEAAAVTNLYTVNLDAGATKVKPAADKLAAPIPQSLQDIQPDVIAGISQVGDLLTTGASRATDEYEKQFRVEQVTQAGMEAARGAVSTAQTPITNAITGTVVGAIDDAGFSAGISGFGLGVTIGTGIAHGINSDQVARETQQAIDERMDAIDAYARAAMGAQSPAKRFYPHGRYIIEGMAVGATKSDALNVAVADKMRSISPVGAGAFGGFGSTPAPPAGLAPVVQVMLDPSMIGSSIDSSIHVGAVHNYGPDIDSRGQGMVGVLRDLQFTGGGI